jgi:hypothetical protein
LFVGLSRSAARKALSNLNLLGGDPQVALVAFELEGLKLTRRYWAIGLAASSDHGRVCRAGRSSTLPDLDLDWLAVFILSIETVLWIERMFLQ